MRNIIALTALLSGVAGFVLFFAGVGGLVYTYANVARENVLTTSDARIPNTPVRGPRTLKAEADVIRVHMLEMSGGKTYAEAPRYIEVKNDDGTPMLDESGEPVMIPNEARQTWITAMTLIATLNLALLAYALSALSVVLGLLFIWNGFVFRTISRSLAPKM